MSQTPEQIQADIERQRAQLASTVDQLGHKLDVKAQTKAKVADVKDRATTDAGKPRPEVIGAAAGVARRARAAHLVAQEPMSSETVHGGEHRTDEAMPDPNDEGKPTKLTDLTQAVAEVRAAQDAARVHRGPVHRPRGRARLLLGAGHLPRGTGAWSRSSGSSGRPTSPSTWCSGRCEPLVSNQMLGTIEPALRQIAESQGAGLALVLGVLGALWSASGYVGAFGRAMNKIYEIDEGRPFWKLRPTMLLLTLVAVVLMAMVLLMLIVSGPVAESIGNVIGLGDVAVTVWAFAKWPVLAVVVVVIVGLLYYATPNVKQPKFRWLSVGAFVAILIWVLASVAFAFYVANFASYNKTYGSLAGVVVALLFLWITNLALLFGAELDAELERGRQLQAGIAAEEELQLPARDTRNIKKARKTRDKDIAFGRKIRREARRSEASSTTTTDGEQSSPEKEKR